MSAPQIHGRAPMLTASCAVETQNSVLTSIKEEDGATWIDMGRVLGKSDDRAAAYGNTASPIDMPTFLFGCKEWGGRFADPLLALAGGRWAEAGSVCTGDTTGAMDMATLLPPILELESDTLEDGPQLLPHEANIRRLRARCDLWLELIAAERGKVEQ